MGGNGDLLDKVAALKAQLVAHAQGQIADPKLYEGLRRELIQTAGIKELLPDCVRRYRNLNEFWSFIQPEFKHYRDRRGYLQKAFEPIFEALESASISPADRDTTNAIAKWDMDTVQREWQKAVDRRFKDPSGALTSARALLESVMKHILHEHSIPFKEAEDLPGLHKLVCQALDLSPARAVGQELKQTLSGCINVVTGVGLVRDRIGDAHGKGKAATKAELRHARLAVDLAGAMAVFLLEEFEDAARSQ